MRLSEFLTNKNGISDSHFRVRRKCNTTLAVFHSVTDLLKSFDNKTYCIYLFLDLRQSIDSVDISFFAGKSKMYSIGCTASLLLNSYFPIGISMLYVTNISRSFVVICFGPPAV